MAPVQTGAAAWSKWPLGSAPSSAPVPPQGAPDSSDWFGTPGKRPAHWAPATASAARASAPGRMFKVPWLAHSPCSHPPAPEARPRTDGSTPCESTCTYRHGGHHNYQLPLFGLSIMLVGGGAIQHFFSGLTTEHLVYSTNVQVSGTPRPLPCTALLLSHVTW